MLPSVAMTVIVPLSTENLTTLLIGSQKTVPSFIWITSRTLASGSELFGVGSSTFFGCDLAGNLGFLTGVFAILAGGEGVAVFVAAFAAGSGAGSTVTLAVLFS